MTKDGESLGKYVHKVREDTRRYVHDLLSENEKLRVLVASLESEKTQLKEEKLLLQERLLLAREELDRIRSEEVSLQRKLASIETEHRQFSEQYEKVEHQNSNLANLYVASYRLHGTLDRQEVLGIIQEIIINLVGSEELGIFELNPKGGVLSLASSVGIDPARYQSIPLGSGLIGRVALSGEPYLGAHPGGAAATPDEVNLTACIPMKLNDKVTGAIAVFHLLPQKDGLEALDHELFDLLATHAAMALYCTSLHTAAGNGGGKKA
jgi:hypothetical protein